MLTFSLQSGSNGNAIYVECGGVRLLFDAGISGVQAERRMAERGRDIRDVDALIISHDHRDHIACAGIYQRKYSLPIYMTTQTHKAAKRYCNLGNISDMRYFKSGDLIDVKGVKIHTVRTPHDAADGVAFVVEHNARRLGILTDLGHPFHELRDLLASVDGAYLECNYDRGKMATSPYPPHLKRRICGPGGHLSNDESASLLAATGRKRPRWIAVAHLSAENNLPELAIEAQRQAIGRDYPVHHASREGSSEIMRV